MICNAHSALLSNKETNFRQLFCDLPLVSPFNSIAVEAMISCSSTFLFVTHVPPLSSLKSFEVYCLSVVSQITLISSSDIYTADESHMPVNHIGSIASPNLPICDICLSPNWSLYLLSATQICELGFNVHFT